MWIKTLILSALLLYTTSAKPVTGPGNDNNINHKKLAKFLKKSVPTIESKYRLSRNTVPRVYMIELDPDFLGDKFTFTGKCSIIFEVLHPTTSVTLHKSNKLDIQGDATELIHSDGKIEKPLKQTWEAQNEFYTMKFENKLPIGNYTLNMKWSGVDSSEDWFDPYTGFYRAENKGENGETSYIVTTHFEPSGARNTFPCWDEPGLKAEFEMSVKHFPNYTALANMPVKSQEKMPDGKVLTHFERSVKMSPYLPCILIADYKAIKNENGNITFYTMEKDLELVKYALEISEKTIPALEAYTNMPYAMPKLDQITVPEYGAVAMEHWGLVSYITYSVLLRNTTLMPNNEKKDKIAFLVAHELAHQWFGNLVSPVWWDDVWPNEAFAAYFQYKVLDQIFPHWRVMDYFVVEHNNEYAFPAEIRLRGSGKPIKFNPTTKIEIEQAFGPVTYNKGAAVVHMIEHILGEEVFREGIQNYLKKHQFKAVVTNNLWDALQEAHDKKYKDKKLNIKSTMEPWIKQTGYPILKVTRDNETDDIVIKQEPNKPSSAGNTWRIPINYATKSNPDFTSTAPTMWMEKDQEELRIANIPKDDWIIVNIQQRGFYRVDYDGENWDKLIGYLHSDDFKKIHPVNRAQLIEDIFERFADESKIDKLILLTLYLHQERDYVVWIPAGKMIQRFTSGMRNSHEEDIFGLFLLVVTNEITEHLGFEHREGDEHSAVKIRSMLAPLVCAYEHADCIAFAHRLFDTYLENPSENAFPSTDWEWIVCAGLRESNESVWDKFMTTDMPMTKSMKNSKYNFIKCLPSKKQRDKYIARTMQEGSKVTPDQINGMFEAFFKSRSDDVNYAIDYVIGYFDNIKKYYDQDEDGNILLLIANMAIYGIKTENQLKKFQKFLEENGKALDDVDFLSPSDALELSKEIDEIETNVAIVAQKIREIIEFDDIDEGKKLRRLKTSES
ncbi:aminopeptidase N-like [Chelonus insularis]|uniref:aminopeptidase N-like n=1 Tax=Chelonus insularis TaxID=460826 RepID=UPI00158E40DC|nr:aminopeptidase N-like [Chelonus insularis]